MVYDSARDTLYITSGGSVLRYQLGSGSFLSPFNLGGSLSGLDLSPDGSTLVVADKTRTETNTWVHVIDLNSGASSKALFPREFGEGGTFTVAYGGDNRVLITSTYEGSGFVPLRQLDPATGAWSKLNNLFNDGGRIDQDTMLAASGDRSVIGFAESNSSDGRWGSYNVPNNTIVHRTWYENGTSWFNYEIGVNKNGTQYAIPTYGGTFIHNSAYAKIATLGVYAGAQPIGVVYHPVEDLVYFPWMTTNEVRAFNTNTFAQVAAYNFEDTFKSNGNWAFRQGRVKMSRDGSLLFATVTGGVRFVRLYAPLAAADQSVTTAENTPVAVTLSGSVGNGGALSYRVVTQPAYGTLSGTAPNLVYTPVANYYGSDSFTFKVNDGAANSSAAAVQINVAPVNDSPVPNPQTVNATEDTAVSVTLTATDVDGDQLSYFLVNPPQHGGFVGGVIPNLVYKANPNYSGPDSFTFYVNDGKSQSAPVTVTINVAAVNDAPVAVGDTGSVFRNSSVSLSVVANDTDADGDNLIVVSVSQPPNGSVSIAAGGKSVTYTPRRNWRGSDAFTYTVSDGRGGTASASVNVTVK